MTVNSHSLPSLLDNAPSLEWDEHAQAQEMRTIGNEAENEAEKERGRERGREGGRGREREREGEEGADGRGRG